MSMQTRERPAGARLGPMACIYRRRDDGESRRVHVRPQFVVSSARDSIPEGMQEGCPDRRLRS